MSLIIKKTSWEDYLDPSGGAFVKALIMGAHGAGKTRSASFWPKPIFADTERGRMSLADRSVPYADIRSTADMDGLLEHLRKECQKPVAGRAYQTLVIDTVDSYQRTIIQERLRAEKREALSGWADWGYLDGKMTQLVERLLNLPMNIVVNLHVKDVSDGGDEDGDNSILVKKARLKGDIKDTIFQDFDLIGQMETSFKAVKGERVLERNIRWASEPRFPNLRDRSGKLPRFTLIDFTEGDYSRIFDTLTGGLDDLPAAETVETIETGATDAEVRPAGTDETGGPVTPPEMPVKGARKAPAKKAAAKKPEPKISVDEPTPTKAAEPGSSPAYDPPAEDKRADTPTDIPADKIAADSESSQVSDPAPTDTSADTPTDAAEAEKARDQAALDTVAAELGGEVVSAPGERAEGECGFQPEQYKAFDAPAGCAKSLENENKAKVNLALLRAKARLCSDCFETWRAA